jgi:deoxyxylulose-5-phosphate synthase
LRNDINSVRQHLAHLDDRQKKRVLKSVFSDEAMPAWLADSLGGQDMTPQSRLERFYATGTMTYEALTAAEKLFGQGIDVEVIHCPTIKPLDKATILKSVERTHAVITVEEAQIIGGLGGAVAELLSEEFPTLLKRIGVRDRFGESGEPQELLDKFGLRAKNLVLAAHDMMERKHKR